MADAIAVQRGTVYTHGMHIYPGDSPTGVWASIEAQNAGLVAGMWQNHMLCSPDSEILEVQKAAIYDPDVAELNLWYFTWPQLGSYSRLSFWANNVIGMGDTEAPYEFYLRLWDLDGAGIFWVGTWRQAFSTGQTHRISMEWDMETVGLDAYLGGTMAIQLAGGRSSNPENGWTVRMNQFLLITANLPL